MTTLYLIRHGTTDSNLQGKFQGCIDIPLNRRGLSQAEYLGKRFAAVPIEVVYASQLIRARKTAEAVAAPHGLPVLIDPQLAEINLGEMEGKTSAENAKIFPDAIRTLAEDPAAFAAPGGESSRQVYDRIRKAIARIVEENAGKTIAVVSHGFSIQTYLHYASGKAFEKLEKLIVGNTAVCCFQFEDPEKPKIVFLNDQSHLPQELRFDLAAEPGPGAAEGIDSCR